MRTKKGFTLVELVFVIVILGVLAAVAFSRFVNLSNEAAENQFKYVMSIYKTSVLSLNVKWAKDNSPASIMVDGITINLSANGWPTGTAGNGHIPLPAEEHDGRPSLQLWYGLLQLTNKISVVVGEGWHAGALIGSVMTYTYTLGSDSWAFTYDTSDGGVSQVAP